MKEYELNIQPGKKNIHKSSLKLGGTDRNGNIIGFTNYYMEFNGRPFFGICGEFQYSRYPERYWDEEILKIRMSGVNIISTYVFWIHHEEEEGVFNWKGNNDLRRFVELCANHCMFVFIRIGPFVHGECRNGGLPDWLFGRKFEVRSNDPGYLSYVKRLYGEIHEQVHDWFFKNNGPIIGVQLENEYMHTGAPWEFTSCQGDMTVDAGKDGKSHMKILKRLALDAGFDVPIYTSTGWGGSPVVNDEILPLYGGYSFCPWNVNEKRPEQPPTDEYIFQDYHNDDYKCRVFSPPYSPSEYPFACCEMGSGMQVWYKSRFVVPFESVTGITIQKVAGGCNFIGYYVFHGGSQPVGIHGFMNEIVVPKISYDFQAPVGEFGQIRDSYRYMKLLFIFFKNFAHLLCPMATVVPENAAGMFPTDKDTLRYAVRTDGHSGFVFINNYQDHVDMHDLDGIRMILGMKERLVIPDNGSIDVKKNVNMILPFNFDIGVMRLKYATLQLITKLECDNHDSYFFFQPDGVKGEYCFESKGITEYKIKNCYSDMRDSKLFIVPDPGKECAIELTDVNGKKFLIHTLSMNEAAGLYKTALNGTDHVVISNADLTVNNDAVVLTSLNERINFRIYPAFENEMECRDACMTINKNGYYSEYSVELKKKIIEFDFKKISDCKAVVKFAGNSFQGINDIFVRIDYEGDVGNAFVDGKLINDNFCNGIPWEIGLKRFWPSLADREICFYIQPLKKGSFVFHESAMALKKEFIGEEKASINSITALPEYKISLKIKK
jgi:hypothetical protein